METVRDAKDVVIETNVFDAMGRLKSREDSAGRTRHYAYDANGNLRQYTDPNGQISQYTYDELDRLIGCRTPMDG